MALKYSRMDLTTDKDSRTSYGIQNIANVKKYGASFGAGEESYIVLEEDDKQFLVIPTAGPYFVAADVNDTYPPAVDGGEMVEVNSEPNSGLRGIDQWPLHSSGEKRLYIKSEVAQEIGVLIFKSRNV